MISVQALDLVHESSNAPAGACVLTQTAFGKLVGMRQPHVARLESGDREPSLSTLARLSAALDVDFTVDITPSGVQLRASA